LRENKLSSGAIEVGLMYCLQDLQLRWPVKAVGREGSVLTGFNISVVTMLQGPAYWFSTGRHHTCKTSQYSCRLPWCYIIVPFKSDCLWTVTDGQTAMKGFCCFIFLHLEEEKRNIC
jgi:hypothetical protein